MQWNNWFNECPLHIGQINQIAHRTLVQAHAVAREGHASTTSQNLQTPSESQCPSVRGPVRPRLSLPHLHPPADDDNTAGGEETTINSGGGDVAGRDIDKRQGVEHSTVIGDIMGQQTIITQRRYKNCWRVGEYSRRLQGVQMEDRMADVLVVERALPVSPQRRVRWGCTSSRLRRRAASAAVSSPSMCRPPVAD